jgi:hypothetical protein
VRHSCAAPGGRDDRDGIGVARAALLVPRRLDVAARAGAIVLALVVLKVILGSCASSARIAATICSALKSVRAMMLLL